MRYSPSTKSGSLFISSLKAVAKIHGHDPILTNRIINHSLAHIEAVETPGEQTVKTESQDEKYLKLDTEFASLFLKWGNALAQQDGHSAVAIAAEIEKLANEPGNQFNYSETKNLFYKNFSKSSYSAARRNYIPPDPANTNFALVENTVSDTAKIGIIGDWGTGTEDAKALFKDMMKHKPEVVLHLGDIYEAGVALEIEEYFLKPISDACSEMRVSKPPIFTIPGNHEYFSGAADYFEMLKVLNKDIDKKWSQEASFFCLRSASGSWQFLGADTGLGCIDHPSSPNLENQEAAWHKKRISEFSGSTVFMTHHQLVSTVNKLNHTNHFDEHTDGNYAYYNRHLVEHFSENNPVTSKPFFDDLNLWLWGHDHHFTAFVKDLEIVHYHKSRSNPTLRRGQLLGGSARDIHHSANAISSLSTWVETQGGKQVRPGSTNPGLKNLTYGILDLGKSHIKYYQSPAWYDGETNANKSPISKELLSYDV